MNATSSTTLNATSGAAPDHHYASMTVALLLLAVGGTWFWSHRHMQQELLALPAQERHHLYEHTLETLQTVCVRASGSALGDYCREQAQFISRFPECDATCQELCRRLAPRPTK